MDAWKKKNNNPEVPKFSIKFGFQCSPDNNSKDSVNAERTGAKCKCLCHEVICRKDQ